MTKKDIAATRIPMNIQMFAEGEEELSLENLANSQPELGLGFGEEIEDVGEVIEEEIVIDPIAQSKDKNNPANSAFKTLRTENAEMKRRLEAQKETDAMYAEMGKAVGRTDVTDAASYARALREMKASDEFKETNDPTALLKNFKDEMMAEIKSSQTSVTAVAQDKLTAAEIEEVEATNTQYGTDLKSFDDIADLENSDQIIEYLGMGLPLPKAYLLANEGTVTKSVSTKARQAAINKAKGQTHVKTPEAKGSVNGIVETTPEELSIWKTTYPNLNSADLNTKIQAAHKL